jgi:hypothetical protein
MLPGPPVSALTPPLPRSLSLPPAPSHCPPGPNVARSHLSAAHVHVAHAPPPSPITRQRHRPRPPTGGRCKPLSRPRRSRGPLSLFPIFPSTRRRTPDPPALFPLRPRHRAAIKGAARRCSPFFTPSPSSTPECHALSSTTPPSPPPVHRR